MISLLTNIQPNISAIVIPMFPVFVNIIVLVKKNDIEKKLMSERSKVYLMLITLLAIAIPIFIELLWLRPRVTGETDIYYVILMGASVMTGVIGCGIYHIIMRRLKTAKFYVLIKDDKGIEKRWIIEKGTDSKKVLLSYVDNDVKETIYKIKDIEDVLKLDIHGINKFSKASPQQVIPNESQQTTNT